MSHQTNDQTQRKKEATEKEEPQPKTQTEIENVAQSAFLT